ncbi:MAG: hypothetical protein AAF411_07040 [Myxococcota bacterium]
MNDKPNTGHACAIREGGRLACWGMNEEGQLGIGTFTGAELYTDSIPLVDELPWIGVAAGAATTCAISGLLEEGVDCPRGRGSGSVYCWGNNGSSEFGYSTTPARRASPEARSLGDATHVVGSDSVFCGRVRDSSIQCWGPPDFGQRGTSILIATIPPSGILLADSTSLIASRPPVAGPRTLFAMDPDGQVHAWGVTNVPGIVPTDGRCEDGEDCLLQAAPIEVGPTIIQVAAGKNMICLLDDEANLRCFGDNTRGQLGTGDPSGYVCLE